MTRTATPSALHLTLADTGEALPRRLAAAVVAALRTGTLGPGDALPSSRVLAADLGVSRAVVVDAYDELAAAGFVDTRAGSGTRVAAGADSAARAGADPHVTAAAPSPAHTPVDPSAEPDRPVLDLSPGYPDTTLLSVRDWRSAWRAAASGPVPNLVPGPRSHLRLRRALSAHLRRTRGVRADADAIVVLPGVAAALRTLAAAADLPGRRVAFEDPGYTKARLALANAGCVIRPIPVDTDGLDPDLIDADDAAVYCTPAHQYPLGGRMPVARRAALVADATRSGRLLIEDDYDGEFRYGVATLPALRAIEGGHDHVAYLGTASKIVTPSLRLAWLVPPPRLLPGIHEVLAASGESVCAVTADALAGFIESGALTRHLARSSRTYRARRQALVTALRTHLPDATPLGIEAGLHLAVRLPDGADDVAVAADIARHGVLVRPLTAYRVVAPGPPGLLCGYARLPESQADAAARVLADVISG